MIFVHLGMYPNVVIVEDNPIIALDLTLFIKRCLPVEVFCCHDEQSAFVLLKEMDQAIVFLDINLDTKFAGVNIAKSMDHNAKFPYVYVTGNTDRETLAQIKGTYPIGFVVKPYKEEEIKVLLELAQHRIKHPLQRAEATEIHIGVLFPDLSKAECKVFLGLFKGHSNEELAKQLFVSTNTVKTHLKSIFVKLDVNSRLKAVQVLLSKL
jgi:DNA-binding NarL/FixJ family response regulator